MPRAEQPNNTCIESFGAYGQLWVTRCPTPSATALAIQQRWIHSEFESTGIKVATLEETDDAQLRMQPVYHNLRGLFHDGGNLAALAARASGYANTTVIGLTCMDEYQALLARPNAGLIGPGSLKYKRLGLPKKSKENQNGGMDMCRAMALRAYLGTLELVGIDSDDVQLTAIPYSVVDHKKSDDALTASVAALISGRVDVIYVHGAAAKRLKRAHALDVVFDISASKNLLTRICNNTPRLLTIDRDYLCENPGIVARYLAVLLQTAKWAELNAKETRRVLAAQLQIDPSSLLSGYGRFLHRHLHVQLTPRLLQALVEQKNFLLAHGFIPADLKRAVRDFLHGSGRPIMPVRGESSLKFRHSKQTMKWNRDPSALNTSTR